MTVQGLDHVNIRVKDMEATAAFFVDVLGMTRSEERSSWITDASGRAVLHLGAADSPYPTDSWYPFDAGVGSGAVHHIALACTGFDAMVERLSGLGVDYRVSEFATMSIRQIQLEEPGGLLVELNFRGA